ncbi:MAG TPA: serine hydrolase [Puia sp.]|jgi:CubicO group peptidase (beta-lactamase class C family)|nr:serine hydrolase [Puia sp.]
MLRYALIFLSTALTLFAATTNAQPTQQELLTTLRHRIDSIVTAAVKADLIPGAVVQIQINGKNLYSKAYGSSQKYDFHRQPLSPAPAMTTSTLFDLASLTKVVGTTTSLMLLADQHKINIDDPVSRYLPGFDTGEKQKITIRHLLTHTAGLYEWYPLFYQSAHRDSAIRFIERLPLRFPVGKQRKYSDLGFMLLGAIIEKISGMPLDQFEEQNIFRPLGMSHTQYNPLKHDETNDIAATSLGNPYEHRMVHDSSLGFAIPGLDPKSWNGWRQYVLKGEVNDGNAWYANEGIAGHAGLFSTASDLQQLVDMLLNKGRAGGERFLSEQTIDTFLTPDAFHNGLGWMMDPDNSFMNNAPAGSFGHTGFTGTSIAVVPEYGLSVIILINRQNIGLQPNSVYCNPNPIRQGIFQAVIQATEAARTDRKHIFNNNINKDSLFQAVLQSLPESRRADFQKHYNEADEQEKEFLLLMLSMPRSSKKAMIANLDSNFANIQTLNTTYAKLVPKDYVVEIEFNPADPLLSTPESIDLEITHNAGNTNSHDKKWQLLYGSTELTEILKPLGWTNQTIQTIKALLAKAKSVSIENGDITTIGYARSGMGKYSFKLFAKPLNKTDVNDYNDGCRYIFYKDNIVLEYGGGAVGPQCFPAEN